MNIKKLLALILVVVLLLCAIPVAYALEEQPAVPGDEDIPLDVEQMDPSEEETLRGDMNGDEAVDVNDGIALIKRVLAGSTDAECDFNDDGAADVNDGIALIKYAINQ